MTSEEIITRRGEFLCELFGSYNNNLSLHVYNGEYVFDHLINEKPERSSLQMGFVSWIPSGYYRGEDSGANYPEYDEPTPIATYQFKKSDLLYNHFGYDILSLIKDLASEKSEWHPVDRHYPLVSFLLERDDTIVSESTEERFLNLNSAIIKYATLNFTFQSNHSLGITQDGNVLAEYDVHEVNILSPHRKVLNFLNTNRPKESPRDYPVYINYPLMVFLKDNPQLMLSRNSFDCFSLIK